MILKHLLNRPALNKPSSQYRQGSSHRRLAGVTVNEDSALTYSAVYLSVKIISETLGALPGNVFNRKPGSDNRTVARHHPLKTLLLQPNSEMTGFTFLSTLISHAALRGGGTAFISRDRSNRPGELQLITPDRVNKGRSRETGKIVYEISNGSAANSYYDDNSIFYLPGMGFDGLTGYSIVSLAARSFGLGMAAEQFGASFYENGAQLGTVIEVPPEINLDDDGATALLDSFDAKHRGVAHHHKTALIDKGMQVKSVGIPQKDAQFIESRKFSITDVARWFNMPPHKLKDLERATFSNIEEQNIDFVQDTLLPWITNLEQTINWKLVGKNNRTQFFKFNVNALMRGDSKSRAEYYNTRFQMGTLSINEIKAFEDENGIGSDGDEYFMQMNMSTVADVVNPPAPTPAPQLPTEPDTTVPPGAAAGGDPSMDSAPGQQAENNLERFKPLVASTIEKLVYNMKSRAARVVKKGDAENEAEALKSIVADRSDDIENAIKPVLLAMVDFDSAHLSCLSDQIADAIATDSTCALTTSFIEFCATITETEANEQ